MCKKEDIFRLTMAAMLASFAFICFSYLRIEIPMGGGMTGKIYVGHTVILLAGLLLGSKYGGFAGAIGLSLADILAGYVMSAPPTFVAKFIIGFACGFLAHNVMNISRVTDSKRLYIVSSMAAGGAMVLNVLTEPVIRYVFKVYVLGYAEQVAYISSVNCAVSMLISAIPSLILAVFLYGVLMNRLPAVRERLHFESI